MEGIALFKVDGPALPAASWPGCSPRPGSVRTTSAASSRTRRRRRRSPISRRALGGDPARIVDTFATLGNRIASSLPHASPWPGPRTGCARARRPARRLLGRSVAGRGDHPVVKIARHRGDRRDRPDAGAAARRARGLDGGRDRAATSPTGRALGRAGVRFVPARPGPATILAPLVAVREVVVHLAARSSPWGDPLGFRARQCRGDRQADRRRRPGRSRAASSTPRPRPSSASAATASTFAAGPGPAGRPINAYARTKLEAERIVDGGAADGDARASALRGARAGRQGDPAAAHAGLVRAACFRSAMAARPCSTRPTCATRPKPSPPPPSAPRPAPPTSPGRAPIGIVEMARALAERLGIGLRVPSVPEPALHALAAARRAGRPGGRPGAAAHPLFRLHPLLVAELRPRRDRGAARLAARLRAGRTRSPMRCRDEGSRPSASSTPARAAIPRSRRSAAAPGGPATFPALVGADRHPDGGADPVRHRLRPGLPRCDRTLSRSACTAG